MSTLNDLKIVNAIRNGSEAAIGEVIDKYSRLLWSVVSPVLRGIGSEEDMEECVADTFIYLWQNPQKFDPQRGALKTWLAVIARSKAVDRCRELARRHEDTLEDTHLVQEMSLIESVLQEESRLLLVAAIRALKEPDREILVRRYYYDQKPREIARVLGMSTKQVDNCLYQTKKKLRAAMGGI